MGMAREEKGCSMNSDLTVIFLTANQHPPGWADFHQRVLLEAIGDYPLIVVSREPLSFIRPALTQHIIDDEPKSHLNMYKQLLKACKLATTPYIATAEDDALYPKEHFDFYRPPLDTIAYDMSRWSLYWWKPVYSVKQRISNSTLIAPREEYIDALEERLAVFPSKPFHVSEVGRYENSLGVKPRKIDKVFCEVPTIHFNSANGTDVKMGTRKRLGQLKAYDIPYWGNAQNITEMYK